jgi:hypothetical protein
MLLALLLDLLQPLGSHHLLIVLQVGLSIELQVHLDFELFVLQIVQ